MKVSPVKRISVVLLILYIGVLCYLYFGNPMTPEELPKTFLSLPMDKIAHFLMILPLPILLFWSFAKSHSIKELGIISFFSILFVSILEGTQNAINPQRQSEFYDLLANYVSIVFVSLIILIGILTKRS